MKRLMTALCAATMSLSFGIASVAPAAAVPFAAPAQAAPGNGVTLVQSRAQTERLQRRQLRREFRRENRQDRREFRRETRQDKREFRREARQDRRQFQRRGNVYYYGGHRGYRSYRPGYREYNGWYFPAAAFIAGAVISGAIANQNSGGNAHVAWCHDRYRSYRVSDNTFQPYNGPRQQCVSPY